MTADELKNIFTPFFTTKATTKKGTGLGLFVIQKIITLHDGSISAVSAPGRGTTFTIKIPILQKRGKG